MAGRMRGRRVLLSDSEDDDIDVEVIIPHPQTRLPSPEIADEIEDEEEEEEDRPMSPTSEDLRSDSAAATGDVPCGNVHQGNGGHGHGYEGIGNGRDHHAPAAAASGQSSPLDILLRQRGVTVEPSWLHSCIQEMEIMHPGFRNFGMERQGEIVLGHMLVADFNAMGAGCLPPSFETLHMTELPGPFVLQVDEISDIGSPLRERYQEHTASLSRCLKLCLTDGVQRVIGIEYRPIPMLRCLSPAGLKICVRNVLVRRGVCLLVPEIVEILGGYVQSLEEARQRAVQEMNKPARGSRHRRGQTEDRPLSERATAAAWPTSAMNGSVAAATTVGPQAHVNQQASVSEQPPAGNSFHVSGVHVEQVPGPQISRTSGTTTHFLQTSTTSHISGTETRTNGVGQATPRSVAQTTVSSYGQQTTRNTTLEVKRKQTTLKWAQPSSSNENNVRMPTGTLDQLSNASLNNRQSVAERTTMPEPSVAHPASVAGEGAHIPMTLDSDDDVFLDADTTVSPLQNQSPRFQEAPFTYLALLKDKLNLELGTSVAAGTIKCVLTGVKEFQFKGCDEFTLIVHVDDGSVITEALIHHKVVQAMVRFSPKEVSAALSSSNRAEALEMKNTLKRFQAFLKKFEGMMDVEYNRLSVIPLVLEMREGADAVDLGTLQERVSKYSLPKPFGLAADTPLIDISSPLNSYLGFTASMWPKFVMLACPLQACDAHLKVFTNIQDYLTTSECALLLYNLTQIAWDRVLLAVAFCNVCTLIIDVVLGTIVAQGTCIFVVGCQCSCRALKSLEVVQCVRCKSTECKVWTFSSKNYPKVNILGALELDNFMG